MRAVAASNYSAGRLAEALEVGAREGLPRFEGLQTAYNSWTAPGTRAS